MKKQKAYRYVTISCVTKKRRHIIKYLNMLCKKRNFLYVINYFFSYECFVLKVNVNFKGKFFIRNILLSLKSNRSQLYLYIYDTLYTDCNTLAK